MLLLLGLPVFAQSSEKAQKLFYDQQYEEAREIYGALLRKSPKNVLNNYRYARCCYELGDVEQAIKHFEIAGERYPLRNYYLGELYFTTYRFDKSIEAYDKYLPTLKDDDERIPQIREKMARAEMAGRFLARVEDVAIVDSMVVDKDDFLAHYRIGSELGVLLQERLRLSEDRVEDKISYMTQRQDRIYFSDSIEGRMDIFTSYRLLDGWSKQMSLSDVINSGGDENYPFLMPDGVTMYFASDGENSMGGYDIFITKYVPATNMYLTPENVGMPFNSPYNDYMMLIDEVNGVGWFATDRYQPEGKVAIYRFVPNEEKKIVKSEDEDYVRQVAQLKLFRKAEVTAGSAPSQKKRQSSGQGKEFEFAVTDRLVYTRAEQFKSPEALAMWEELNVLMDEQENMRGQLEALRREYAQEKDDAALAVIASKILALEKKIHEQEATVHEKMLQVRNEEIKALKP